MLSNLFQDNDFVYFMSHSALDKKPYEFGHSRLSEVEWLNEFIPAYFSINPLDPHVNRNEKGAGTSRASINVTAFRNFLFEIDSLPLDEQERLIRHLALKLPPAQVTFSGSSSLHMIISVADTLPFKPHTPEGIAQYSQAWRALNAELTEISSEFLGASCPGLLFDPSCKDPSRLSRTPGAVRPDNNVVQSELAGFGGYISADDVLRLMHKHKLGEAYAPAPKVSLESEMDLRLLKLRLLYEENRGLRSKIVAVNDWASSEYMYPVIFQLTLWIIDSVGAPLSTTLAFLRSEVFPAVKAAGYPRNPEIAVHNAYIWKGLS